MNNYTVGKLYIRKLYGNKIIFVVVKDCETFINIKLLKKHKHYSCNRMYSVFISDLKVA